MALFSLFFGFMLAWMLVEMFPLLIWVAGLWLVFKCGMLLYAHYCYKQEGSDNE